MSIGLTRSSLLFFTLVGGAIFQNVQKRAEETPKRPNETRQAPTIPRTWDDEAIASLEIPLPDPTASPVHMKSDQYYGLPIRPIYRSYPVYAPNNEPKGYLESLAQREPEISFDASRLKTPADWIRAGETVFEAPIGYDTLPALVQDPDFYVKTATPVAKDGTVPFFRYVIRKKGKVELGNFSCGSCHTRVMADGGIIKGAQGNFPLDRAIAFRLRSGAVPVQILRQVDISLYSAPWVKPDPASGLEESSLEQIAAMHDRVPPGVLARHRSSLNDPVQVPDLIGVKDRKYLDRTGLVLHRSIGDLMRYAAMNQGGDHRSLFQDFRPYDVRKIIGTDARYSDEALYALALYLHSLKPPPNPNKFDEVAARGKLVFEREGCAMCHTPPLYTNNKLTPAEGFKVPEDHHKKYDILPISVGTDPNLTLKTRRGTGYYKVPSLKGVWYRGPFEHSGSLATLQDWFDPRRLNPDYVPTGFRGAGMQSRAIKGHEFGLDLSDEDKKALIAFLKTL
jgi:hypothetical protein